MNSEFLAQLDYLGQERGISREVLLDSLEKAIATAAKKDPQNPENIEIKINPVTGELKAHADYLVVENGASLAPAPLVAEGPYVSRMHLSKALETHPDAKQGECIQVEVKPQNLGRIAAQTARQVMLQQLRKAEKAIVQQEFREKLDQIVSGVVRRIEAGSLVVDMQKAEGILRKEDQIAGERYSIGDRINAVIKEIESKGSGPSLILTRASADFVRRLFEREVAEIHSGIVQIKGIAREAGSRTKIAVLSSDAHVDAIGACVGVRGMRVKNITNELSGEKIDIVKWDDDIRNYISNALQPALVKGMDIDEKSKSVLLRVAPDQFALALGKKGQNLRLTSKLCGWKIEIQELKEESSFQEKMALAVDALAKQIGISSASAGKIISAGYTDINGLLAADISDIRGMEGLDPSEMETLCAAVEKARQGTEAV